MVSLYSNGSLTNAPTNIFEKCVDLWLCSVSIKTSQKCYLNGAHSRNTRICVWAQALIFGSRTNHLCVPLRWELSICQHLSRSKCKEGTEQEMVTEDLSFQARPSWTWPPSHILMTSPFWSWEPAHTESSSSPGVLLWPITCTWRVITKPVVISVQLTVSHAHSHTMTSHPGRVTQLDYSLYPAINHLRTFLPLSDVFSIHLPHNPSFISL